MSEWISVEDRTPEDYGEYLVAWLPNDCPFPDTETCFIGICEYELSSAYDRAKNRFKGEWLTESIDTTGQYGGIDIYAWMELPEQYVIGKVKRGGTGMTHELKILPEYYEEVKAGNKNFELRKNDRDYMVHDTLRLRAWKDGQYLDKPPLERVISYILMDCKEYGLMDGYVILGF